MSKRIVIFLLFVITNISIFSYSILAQEKPDRQTTTITTTTTTYDERGNPLSKTIVSGNTVEQILPRRYLAPATNASIYNPPQDTEKPKEKTSEEMAPIEEDTDTPMEEPAIDEVEDALDKVLGERASATVAKEKTKDILKTVPSSQEDDKIKKALEAYKIKKRSVRPVIYKKDKVVEYQNPYKQDRGNVLDLIPKLPEYKPKEESKPSDHKLNQ